MQYKFKYCAWDDKGKVLDTGCWHGFSHPDQVKEFARKWYKEEFVGMDKQVEIYEEAKTRPEYRFQNWNNKK